MAAAPRGSRGLAARADRSQRAPAPVSVAIRAPRRRIGRIRGGSTPTRGPRRHVWAPRGVRQHRQAVRSGARPPATPGRRPCRSVPRARSGPVCHSRRRPHGRGRHRRGSRRHARPAIHGHGSVSSRRRPRSVKDPEQQPGHIGQQGREVGAAHRRLRFGRAASGWAQPADQCRQSERMHQPGRLVTGHRAGIAPGSCAPAPSAARSAPGRVGRYPCAAPGPSQARSVPAAGRTGPVTPGRSWSPHQREVSHARRLGRRRGGAWPLVRWQFALQALQRASHAVLDSVAGNHAGGAAVAIGSGVDPTVQLGT